ncbi:hypothetical protein TNIN_219411 [Trichonephila inaurata madagascariensis]|uniref:Uncharacterized protein n=1 Tax=Trichonephila inaurata madagascariensis TaxID=2747483 RepID=A0A8X6YR94_9ARAC|nr:hypothetical protein TNIN_219411 [Trichonephila inaurata madagascariensis]
MPLHGHVLVLLGYHMRSYIRLAPRIDPERPCLGCGSSLEEKVSEIVIDRQNLKPMRIKARGLWCINDKRRLDTCKEWGGVGTCGVGSVDFLKDQVIVWGQSHKNGFDFVGGLGDVLGVIICSVEDCITIVNFNLLILLLAYIFSSFLRENKIFNFAALLPPNAGLMTAQLVF